MTIDPLRDAHRARPFHPFTICQADGQRFDISHPESLIVPPVPVRTIVVAAPHGSYRVLELRLVTALEFEYGEAEMLRAPDRSGDADDSARDSDFR